MSKTLRQKITDIRNEFINSLPSRIEKLTVLMQILQKTWDVQAARDLMQEIHNIRGFSSTHNFIPLNTKAEQAESLVNNLRDNNKMLSPSQQLELTRSIESLIERINNIYLKSQQNSDETPNEPNESGAPLILVVDDDNNFCNTLCLQLQHLGYQTEAIQDFKFLKESILKFHPKAIFMDIVFEGNNETGPEIIKRLCEKEEICLPVVYISGYDDLQSRLNAVRSYSAGFLNKNFSLADLKNLLDVLAPVHKNSHAKVLIIDDDKISAAYCAAILEHAGIKVQSVEDPENVFNSILNFDPDVILLDMYMPKINGFEMASIIRQHQNFSAIPIVIMSSETDINKQFKMRRAGADDFILKPFKPHHLVDTIHNRIQRSRQTKRLIYTDGLTGLMLFPKIKDQIFNLFESCVRYNLDFSIVSIDLDHFKQVNDIYGHLIGDQILRNFSEYVLSKTRKSDIVTRAGGEEFIIVLPYTNAENAYRAINSLREEFAQRLQYSDGQSFNITFSAGLASTNHFHDIESMLEAADQALYAAKEKGRNLVEMAK